MVPITSLIFRNSTLGVLLVVILTPIGTFVVSEKPVEAIAIVINTILVLFAHRNNLKEILKSENSRYNT